MSKDIVVDVNKLAESQLSTTSRSAKLYEFMAIPYNADFPILREVMQVIDNGGTIDSALKDKMEKAVLRHAQARQLKFAHQAPPNTDITLDAAILDVSKIIDAEFDLNKILAIGLKAINEGTDVASAIREAESSIKRKMVESNSEDFKRDGVVMDVDGQKILVQTAEEIKTLFPEFTGEQASYIIHMGNQSLLGGAGALLILSIGQSRDTTFQERCNSHNVTRYVSMRNGRVELTSSKDFYVQNVSDMVEEDQQKETVLNVVRSSLVVDITSLRGEEFNLGRATGDVPTHLVTQSIKGDNKALLKAIRTEVGSKAIVVEGSKELIDGIESSRSMGGKFQINARKEKERHQDFNASTAAINIRQNIHEDLATLNEIERTASFLKQLSHSTEFIADRMGAEYSSNTKLWASWRIYSGQERVLSGALDNKYAASAKIYAALENDPNKRLSYVSQKVQEYAANEKSPSKNIVSSIVSQILPGSVKILEKDSDIILRAAVDNKHLGFKDRFMKIVDRVRASVGLISQDVYRVATKVRQDRKTARKQLAEKIKSPRTEVAYTQR